MQYLSRLLYDVGVIADNGNVPSNVLIRGLYYLATRDIVLNLVVSVRDNAK